MSRIGRGDAVDLEKRPTQDPNECRVIGLITETRIQIVQSKLDADTVANKSVNGNEQSQEVSGAIAGILKRQLNVWRKLLQGVHLQGAL
jgi:hypothetical protein